MPLNPDELDRLLQVLRAHGVLEFKTTDLELKFTPQAPEVRTLTRANESRPSVTKPKSIWEDPNLWPGGEPPSFPTSED